MKSDFKYLINKRYPLFFRYRRLRKQSPHRRGRLNFAHRLGELLEPVINSGKDVTFTNDIALVKLSRKVRFTDKVQPIKMPKGGFSYQGYQAYVSGWGIQSPYEGPSSVLKGAELVVSSYLIFLFPSHSALQLILIKFQLPSTKPT